MLHHEVSIRAYYDVYQDLGPRVSLCVSAGGDEHEVILMDWDQTVRLADELSEFINHATWDEHEDE